MKGLFLAHVAATLAMVGVIWFVQIVHYPLFAVVGSASFADYELQHQRRTSLLVVPLMLTELATALALLWQQPMGVARWQVWLGLVVLGLIWLSTFAIQVQQHTILSRGFDQAAHQWLVLSNWIRTLAWSMRGALVLWMLVRALP
jgi:hypothetical protein